MPRIVNLPNPLEERSTSHASSRWHANTSRTITALAARNYLPCNLYEPRPVRPIRLPDRRHATGSISLGRRLAVARQSEEESVPTAHSA